MDLGLKDVHVLVSGANGGIGIHTVKLFLGREQGARVTAAYNSSSTALNEDGDIVEYRGRGLLQIVQADVVQEVSVDRLFEQAVRGMGGHAVQVLVVNHAVYEDKPSPISEMSLDQFKRTHDVNLTGSFLLIRRFLRDLKAARDEDTLKDIVSVVLIGSTAGEFGEANHADYASSKSALTHGLMLSLKNEIVKIHPRGRVNTVAPGWVSTPMAAKSMANPDIAYQALATTPLNKIAAPGDVAQQIVILASQKVSGHETGQIVRLHGGMEGRLLNPKA